MHRPFRQQGVRRPSALLLLAAFAAVAGGVSAGPAAGFARCRVSGRTEPGAWVVSNCGQVARADGKGFYELELPVQGVYCLKAMKDGFGEVARPWLEVPAKAPVDLPLWAHPDPARRVVHGDLGHPAQLVITDSGRPVRGFDFAGVEIGGYAAPKGVWHERNPFFWTLGEYCFTATGEVSVVETPSFPELRRRGWYQGDFHAHIVHGESFYGANLQQMDFICRAEGYDWIYLSGGHANDGYPVDFAELSRFLSDGRLFLRVNNEFPKNVYGHFGNLNCPPLTVGDYGPGYDEDLVTDLELAERTVYAGGGLAVPVHPLYGDGVRTDARTGRKTYWMLNNELALWLLCRPDLVPVVDFFYFPEERAERFWYRLLNRGYRLGCSGTSDAAMDIGRSPRASHATFARIAGRIDGDAIVRAFREGRTMVSYRGAAVVLEIDGKTSGDTFAPDGTARRLKADAYVEPGRRMTLRVIRNGEVFAEKTDVAGPDGRFSLEREIVERDTAWYVATLKDEGGRSPRAAASPIYFRGPGFRPPEVLPLPKPLPRRIKERILRLTPEEADSDAWWDELTGLLKEAAR